MARVCRNARQKLDQLYAIAPQLASKVVHYQRLTETDLSIQLSIAVRDTYRTSGTRHSPKPVLVLIEYGF